MSIENNEPTIEQIVNEQRATDPRLAHTPVTPDPTPDPVVENKGEELEDPVEVQPVEQPKPKKTAEEVLKGRVGHLTKTLSAKDQALADREKELNEYRSKLAATEALLNSNGQLPAEQPKTVTPATANGNTTYTQEEFEAAVARQAEIQEFNRKADEMYNVGASKFNDWKDSVDTLVAAGFMNKDLLDAALAVEDGPSVLHHLGSNLDEAERISALPPVRKAAEMAKLSSTLNAPRQTPVSAAPAPIKPVSGSPSPQVDLQRISDTDDMKAYIAARAKQGARWANPGGSR